MEFLDFLSPQFFSALAAIVVIDLVLAGDNAIVIALAARNLPAHLQKRAIVWGTVGAISVRALMTMVVVWLLDIPGLMVAGGVLLIWIAIKLLAPANSAGADHEPNATDFWGAMRTIVIADAVMGLDNVLGVAGAAHGDFLLVVLGLLISVPIMVWGSTLILKWVERFPLISYVGAAVLAWTAAKMITSEPLLVPMIEPYEPFIWLAYVLFIAGVLSAGFWLNRRKAIKAPTSAAGNSSPQPQSDRRSIMNVLVPIHDDTATRAIVRHLRELAGSGPLHTHLLYVAPKLPRHIARFLDRGAAVDYFRQVASKALSPVQRALATAGIESSRYFAQGDVAGNIAQAARALNCSEIVFTRKRRFGLERVINTSVSDQVMRQTDIPVAVVPAGEPSLGERLVVPSGVAAALLLVALD